MAPYTGLKGLYIALVFPLEQVKQLKHRSGVLAIHDVESSHTKLISSISPVAALACEELQRGRKQ